MERLFIGIYVGVYLKQEENCVKAKWFGHIAEKLNEKSGFLFLSYY